MVRDLGAVVVHYFREIEAANLVEHLHRVEGIYEASIVLVDNGSRDGRLIEELERRRLHPTVTHQANIGYGAAVNLGVGLLPPSVEDFLILTHEVVLHAGAVYQLQRALHSNPSVGMVGPMLLRRETDTIWSLGGRTSRIRALPGHRGAGVRHDSSPLNTWPSKPCDWLDGAVVMLSRESFVSVGGISEEYFLYFEDVDLGWKLRQMGYEVVCVPAAVAEQSPGGALDQYLATRNLLWMLRRQRRWGAWVLFFLESFGRLLIGAVARPGGAFNRQVLRLRGLRHGLRQPTGLGQ